MKVSYLAALVAVCSSLLLPSVASADLSWNLNFVISGTTTPSGSPPWARATLQDVADTNGDTFADVKFTLELFLTDDQFVSDFVFNFNPSKDVTSLSSAFVSGQDSTDFDTVEDGIATGGGVGKGDLAWRFETANTSERFENSEMAMFNVSSSDGDIFASDFDFLFPKSNFVNTLAHVQGIPDPNDPNATTSVWIGNPEPSSMVLAALALGGLGITRLRRRKVSVQAA